MNLQNKLEKGCTVIYSGCPCHSGSGWYLCSELTVRLRKNQKLQDLPEWKDKLCGVIFARFSQYFLGICKYRDQQMTLAHFRVVRSDICLSAGLTYLFITGAIYVYVWSCRCWVMGRTLQDCNFDVAYSHRTLSGPVSTHHGWFTVIQTRSLDQQTKYKLYTSSIRGNVSLAVWKGVKLYTLKWECNFHFLFH